MFQMADQTLQLADEFFKLAPEQKPCWEMDKWGDMQFGGVSILIPRPVLKALRPALIYENSTMTYVS